MSARRAAAWLLAMLGAMTGISVFQRSALGVVAPDLALSGGLGGYLFSKDAPPRG